MKKAVFGILFILILFPALNFRVPAPDSPWYISDIKIAGDYGFLIACEGTREVLLIGPSGETIRSWQFSDPATGIAIDGNRAYITTAGASGRLTILDISKPGKVNEIRVGMGAMSPLLSPDKKTLFVAARFENTVYKVDVHAMVVTGKAAVLREPFAMAVSPDGKYLFVNNSLPAQRADIEFVAADISVIGLSGFSSIKDIKLANGSNALKGICLSPDGNYLYVTHNLGRFQVPTSQLEQGWMNTAGLSIIDARRLEFLATVVLDEPERGASGSWDVQCTAGKILVTHSGTHDISIIDQRDFMEKLLSEPIREGLSHDLHFLDGIRRRFPLQGNGPRTIAVSGETAIVPAYFSDLLNVFDIATGSSREIVLNPGRIESPEDAGYRIFNDAAYCFQGWQSCNGCHPGEARTDGLNWDLLNDGIGNPKNCKSLLFAHKTPPVMISGIRGNAEVAVRAGFKHIQFSSITEEDAKLVDAYLRSLVPVPSPWLVNGKLSQKAKKGKQVYERSGCADCHGGEYYTDLNSYKIGEEETVNGSWKGWDTPTLREIWRTAPYLHNGCAYTMEDVFEVHRHGLKQELSKEEISQLAEYLNSL